MTNNNQSVEQILNVIKEKNIYIVYFNFIDFDGNLRTKGVLSSELLRNSFSSIQDGVSVNGIKIGSSFDPIETLLFPIISTFTVIEWSNDSNYLTAFIMCDVSYSSNPRTILNEVVIKYDDFGLNPMSGYGLMYKVLNQIEIDEVDYYKLLPDHEINKLSIDLTRILESHGVEIEYLLPYGKSHSAIVFTPKNILEVADNTILSRWISQSYTLSRGMKLEFVREDEVLGALHMSVWKNDEFRNLFFDPNDKLQFSKLGYSFIAGILANFDEIFAVIIGTSNNFPSINYTKSYKSEKGCDIVNITTYFNEEQKKDRKGWSKRCVFNGLLDGANLYLAISAIYLSGLDGIKRELNINEYVDIHYNVCTSSLEEKLKKLSTNRLFVEYFGVSTIEGIKETSSQRHKGK